MLTDDPAIVASDRLLVRLGSPVGRSDAGTDPSRERRRPTRASAGVGATPSIWLMAGSVPSSAWPNRSRRRAATEPSCAGRQGRIRSSASWSSTPRRRGGISRRRQSSERVGRLAGASSAGTGVEAARLDLHGAVLSAKGGIRWRRTSTSWRGPAVMAAVGVRHDPRSGQDAEAAIAAPSGHDRTCGRGCGRIDHRRRLVGDGPSRPRRGRCPTRRHRCSRPRRRSTRSSRPPWIGWKQALPSLAPPGLAEAAQAHRLHLERGCALERSGRIVVLEPDLAYATSTYGELAARALVSGATAPLTPAGLRDDTGHQPQVRDGDPRRSGPSRDPPTHTRRPRARPSSAA